MVTPILNPSIILLRSLFNPIIILFTLLKEKKAIKVPKVTSYTHIIGLNCEPFFF